MEEIKEEIKEEEYSLKKWRAELKRRERHHAISRMLRGNY